MPCLLERRCCYSAGGMIGTADTTGDLHHSAASSVPPKCSRADRSHRCGRRSRFRACRSRRSAATDLRPRNRSPGRAARPRSGGPPGRSPRSARSRRRARRLARRQRLLLVVGVLGAVRQLCAGSSLPVRGAEPAASSTIPFGSWALTKVTSVAVGSKHAEGDEEVGVGGRRGDEELRGKRAR